MIIEFDKLDLNGFNPLFGENPVVAKLITGEEVICIAYQHYEDDRLIFKKPLLLSFVTDESKETGAMQVKAKFTRWLVLSDDNAHIVSNDSVSVFALLSPALVDSYHTWSEKLYRRESGLKSSDSSKSISAVDTKETAFDLFDEILQTYTPKGRPN